MTITTRFDVGDTVYKPFNEYIRAYIVTDIHLHVFNEDAIQVLYKLTRNTNTQYPSGGELSDVQEFDISKDPE